MSAVNELVITPEFVTNIIAVDLADETTFTTADKAKLNGIEAGAQVNTVTRVAGKTGVVELDAGDIGYDGSTAYDTGTVGKELTHLNRQLSDVEENQIPELKSQIEALDNQFQYAFTPVITSDVEDGYINTDGQIAGTGSSVRHVSLNITTDMIGETFYITGTAWWGVKPWVFIGSDNTISYADVPYPSGKVTEYTDLTFTPTKTGILYNNWHTDSGKHNITTSQIAYLKDTSLPPNISNKIYDINSYNELSYTTTTGKYVNASNGTFTTVTSEDAYNAVITNYIPVTEGLPYLISTDHFWGQGMYVFYDANKNYISGKAANSGSTITKIRLEKAVAPANAHYLIVGEWTQGNPVSIHVFEGEEKSILPSKQWDGIKWVCVGDSLTEQNDKASRHYYDYIEEATGITKVIMGVGGTGYARGYDTNNAFYQRVHSVPSDADVITIFGSFNDLGADLQLGDADDDDTTTIAGCMNVTIQNIIDIIPTANIGIIAPCPWGTTRPDTSGSAFNYVSMLEAVANRWSIPFLDLWKCSGLRPWDSDFLSAAYPSDDSVHPNEIGHGILATKIKVFLETLLM